MYWYVSLRAIPHITLSLCKSKGQGQGQAKHQISHQETLLDILPLILVASQERLETRGSFSFRNPLLYSKLNLNPPRISPRSCLRSRERDHNTPNHSTTNLNLPGKH